MIVDQFEELYTLTPSSQQQPFFNLLLNAVKFAPNFSLVITLRADFYGHAISNRDFSDILQQGIYNYSPMNQEELRAVIEKPAALMKVELEPGLTDKLIDDLGTQPGRLPLLEFTLFQIWEKHDKWFLTHEAYKEIGGLETALAKYASGIINPLSAHNKQKAERIFIQLISPGEGTEDTKRKATRSEVGEDNWDLVEELANKRLIVTGWDESTQQQTVEIIHEALIREWGMLRDWIKSNRRFRIWQERLQFTVVQWESKQRNQDYLLTGGNLGEAEEWYFDKKYRNYLSDSQAEFIRESLVAKDRKIKKEKRLQQRAIKWLSGGLLAASLATGFAGFNWVKADISATGQKLENSVINSKTSFGLDNYGDALFEAIKARQSLDSYWWKDWIPNHVKQKINIAINQPTDLWSSKVKHSLTGHKKSVSSVVLSHDGKTIASASDDGTVKLWSADGKLLHTLTGHKSYVRSVVFSPDGKTIASASHDNTVKLWNWNPDNLVELGCNKLEGYLIDRPEKLEELKVCQNQEIFIAAAPTLVEQGEELARNNQVEDAVEKFNKANKWNSELKINPQGKVESISLVSEGIELAQKGEVKAAVEKFKQAQKFDKNIDLNPDTEKLDKNPEAVAREIKNK